MKDYFQNIANELFKNTQSDEFLILNFDAEVSNFIRLNKGKIRQPGNVKQISISLSLSNKDKRNLKSFVRLNGNFQRDISTLIRTLNYLERTPRSSKGSIPNVLKMFNQLKSLDLMKQVMTEKI